MAGEQSSGTFVPVPGETPELKARSAARVEKPRGARARLTTPSLPGSSAPSDGRRARRRAATLSWPLDNIGPSLPNLMATVAGNLFELKQFSGLRILDIRLPDAFAAAYPGPKFAVDGTRKLTGVRGATADRHNRQAIDRLLAAGDGRVGRQIVRGRASTSSRTTNCNRTDPGVLSSERARAVMRVIERSRASASAER